MLHPPDKNRKRLVVPENNEPLQFFTHIEVETIGLEPGQDSPDKTHFSELGDVESDVNHATPPTTTPDPAFALLASAWPHLSDEDRRAVLAIVRKTIERTSPQEGV